MRARVKLPASAKRGEVVTVRTLAPHPMHTGYGRDLHGTLVPRHIICEFVCRYRGGEAFRARLGPGVAANPFLEFRLRAVESGAVTFIWRTDRGEELIVERHLEVT